MPDTNTELPEGFFVEKNTIPPWIKLDGVKDLNPNVLQQAIRAAGEWKEKYTYDGELIIRGMESFKDIDPIRGEVNVIEAANHGRVSISNHYNARHIVLHAMTHASSPEGIIEPNFARKIVSFHGLSVVYTLPYEDKTKTFGWFEEGMAERNASAFRGYFPPNGEYHAVGLTTLRYFPITLGNKDHELVRNNDLPSFVRRVLQLPESQTITETEILQAMEMYTRIVEKATQLKSFEETLAEFGPKSWK